MRQKLCIVGSDNNTSDAVGWKQKQIVDHQGWVQKLPSTKDNSKNICFPIT